MTKSKSALLKIDRLPGVPLSHHRQHVRADGGVVNVTPHAAASQVAEQGQGKGVAHGVNVQVRDKLRQGLPSQEDGAHALPQQGEVGEQARLHKQPVPQEHKLNRPREHNVEPTPRPVQNLLAGHAEIPRVHHKVDVRVSDSVHFQVSLLGIKCWHP